MFKKIIKKLFTATQVIFITLYIIFEELVWERFAEPIFKYIKHLNLFKKLESYLHNKNRYIILILFILPFLLGELIGLLSPIIALKGYILLGVALYALKLIIVAFAFWLFNVEQKKLLSFKIIDFSYKKIKELSSWVKSSKTFIFLKQKAIQTKLFIKIFARNIKNRIKILLKK